MVRGRDLVPPPSPHVNGFFYIPIYVDITVEPVVTRQMCDGRSRLSLPATVRVNPDVSLCRRKSGLMQLPDTIHSDVEVRRGSTTDVTAVS